MDSQRSLIRRIYRNYMQEVSLRPSVAANPPNGQVNCCLPKDVWGWQAERSVELQQLLPSAAPVC